MPQLTKWHAGGGALLVAVGGVAWWLAASDETPEPEPLRAECEGRGFADLERLGEFDPLTLERAPEAIRTEPEPGERVRPQVSLDFESPLGRATPWRVGYVLDRDSATVSYTSASGGETEPEWEREISDIPLDIISDITGFPGRHELVMVIGRLVDSDASIATVLDGDGGDVLISCTTHDVPNGDEVILPTVTADGAYLLVPNVD
ncbi:hypothetical protein, partial [Phytoactinopolyspora endophytica]|uniref:hypothetical protein n=1 Tax=Phytoactinopolyspora endophytica TaxID=1642495 RepID=UPI00197C4F00